MKIEVELKNSYGRLLNREPVFICDELFKLSLITNYQMSEIIVVFKNGDIERTLHYSNVKEFAIPSDVLVAGALCISVSLLSFGFAVRTWEIEPILLKEADTGMTVFLPLECMDRRLTEQVQKVERLSEEISSLSLIVDDLRQQVERLWEIQEA